MTNTEFAEVIAYITAGCGKPLSVDSQVVYFDLLGDLYTLPIEGGTATAISRGPAWPRGTPGGNWAQVVTPHGQGSR